MELKNRLTGTYVVLSTIPCMIAEALFFVGQYFCSSCGWDGTAQCKLAMRKKRSSLPAHGPNILRTIYTYTLEAIY